MTVRILFDLRSGWGVGDGVQSSILWKHLRKYRPHWLAEVRAPGAFAAAVAPLVHAFWPSEGPDPAGEYESVVVLGWTDCFETFADRPSTKVAYALKNVFGIDEYDPALGRYTVEKDAAVLERPAPNAVACHFAGSSHPAQKNLCMADREAIRRCAADLGSMPLGLDYYRGVGELAAAISGCRAFIGIDSGPGKVASATDTPTLICWTGHHPLRYHDPAPNTMHLIPERWHAEPLFNDEQVPLKVRMAACRYFLDNYKHRVYEPGELAQQACAWLREVLSQVSGRAPPQTPPAGLRVQP